MARKGSGYFFDEKTQKYVISKNYKGQRLFKRTEYGAGNRDSVEQELAEWITKLKEAKEKTERGDHAFREAAVK